MCPFRTHTHPFHITTSDGTTILSNGTHADHAYNVNAGSGVSFIYAPTERTCTSVSCHTGDVIPRVWGNQ